MINPTREMDDAISVECPSPDCDCPSCRCEFGPDYVTHDNRLDPPADPSGHLAAMQHRRNALEFLAEAARALDQAHAELNDIGLAREIPAPSMIVDYGEIFPGNDKRQRVEHCLNVQELLQSVMALHQEVAREA